MDRCERRGIRARRPTDNAGNHLSGVQEGLGGEVSVALGHARLSVPKKTLDHVKRDTLVHQEAGEGVAQIMEANVSQTCTAPDTAPRIEQGRERMTCNGRWEDVFGSRRAGQRLQQADGGAVKRDNPGFAGLGQRPPATFVFASPHAPIWPG
jgi:hypothetical protein